MNFIISFIEIMNKLHGMEVFVAVCEEGGFNAASRRLRLSPPSVTRTVANLESELNVKLLNRTTRYVKPTEAGEQYLVDAKRLLTELQNIEDELRGDRELPQGHLGITAPVLFGRIFVMPIVVEYLKTYPETDVTTLFLDRVVSLIEEGVDVAIRIGELQDSSMRARKVGDVCHRLCASPDYLKTHGVPSHPNELNQHELIASSAGGFSHEWHFKKTSRYRLSPRLVAATNDAAIEAAVRGFGIVRTLSYQTAAAIEDGLLIPLLQDYEPPDLPVHILHREGQFENSRVRSFVDLLAEELSQDPRLKA